VFRYLAATGRGDVTDALNEWTVWVSPTDPRLHASDELIRRRDDLTSALAAGHVGRELSITATDWWSTCCDPRPTTDRGNAGLARVHVTARGDDGHDHRLVFEIYVKDIVWWGSAGGDWFQDWRLYEVHTEEQQCLFGSTAVGCARPTS